MRLLLIITILRLRAAHANRKEMSTRTFLTHSAKADGRAERAPAGNRVREMSFGNALVLIQEGLANVHMGQVMPLRPQAVSNHD